MDRDAIQYPQVQVRRQQHGLWLGRLGQGYIGSGGVRGAGSARTVVSNSQEAQGTREGSAQMSSPAESVSLCKHLMEQLCGLQIQGERDTHYLLQGDPAEVKRLHMAGDGTGASLVSHRRGLLTQCKLRCFGTERRPRHTSTKNCERERPQAVEAGRGRVRATEEPGAVHTM